MSEPLRIRGWRLVAACVLWPSFLVAAAASVVFFANIDPATLESQTLPGWDLDRRTGYALGFFMFWAVCAASSYLTVFLFRPGDRKGHDN
ncbi:hypothetical protein [Arhodomonas sp. AD133]|uniref:hypothetical protein n=1 Tax=Arhodomonas sp. AD133 TaxID=3415009 RepID=UPI003EC05503